MSATRLPVPTPEQTTQGCRLSTTLGMVVQSYQDWFAQGVPHEWVRALDQIQQVLTRCKRAAAQAAQEGKPMPGQSELFAAAGAAARRRPSRLA